jgi:hypothetical protein
VKAESPILLHGGKTNGAVLVGLDDILGLGTTVEVEVDASAQSPPGDARWLEDNLLGMSITLVNSMSVRRVLGRLVRDIRNIGELARLAIGKVSGVKIDGMGAINVVVDVITNVCGKQGP